MMQTKLIESGELESRVASLDRPLVFTNGVFDILHVGHVDYLARARLMGRSLLVAVNSDQSAQGLGKGPGRPLNRAIDRARVLAALECVTAVVIFDEHTPCALVQRCRPDIYVKGGDYDMDALEEARIVRSWGGTAVAMPFVSGYSTTSLVDRIRRES